MFNMTLWFNDNSEPIGKDYANLPELLREAATLVEETGVIPKLIQIEMMIHPVRMN